MAQSEISEEGGNSSSLYVLSPALTLTPSACQVLQLLYASVKRACPANSQARNLYGNAGARRCRHAPVRRRAHKCLHTARPLAAERGHVCCTDTPRGQLLQLVASCRRGAVAFCSRALCLAKGAVATGRAWHNAWVSKEWGRLMFIL